MSAYVLLGAPVDHSASPAIHRAAFETLELDARYEAREVSAAELVPAMRAWSARGGGNVTLPHKERAAAALEAWSDAVEATGACNCFWRDGRGRLAGDNTDVDGFLAAVDELLTAEPLADARVLLLGAGGAARATAYACLRAGVRKVEVLNRTGPRARAMEREIPGAAGRLEALSPPAQLRGGYDLVVNATSLGLRPADPLPLALEGLEAGAVLDLVYAPGETEWCRRARRLGIPAADGLGMLVHQAAFSLRRWRPGVEPPLEVMRAAARTALESRAA